MKRFCLLFVLLFGLTAHAADHAAEDALKSSLKGKDLYLRNYSAHSAIAYHIENNKLISSRPGVLALTKLHVDDVKIKGADVTIHAQRSGTEDVLDPHAFHAISRVELKINLGTADPAKALAALPHLLFYDNYDDALAGIPEPWRKSVIRTLNPTSNEPACHCSAYLDDNGGQAAKSLICTPSGILRGCGSGKCPGHGCRRLDCAGGWLPWPADVAV